VVKFIFIVSALVIVLMLAFPSRLKFPPKKAGRNRLSAQVRYCVLESSKIEAEFATKVLEWSRVKQRDGTWSGYPPGDAVLREVPLYATESDLPLLYEALMRRFGWFGIPPEAVDDFGVFADVGGVRAHGATSRLALLNAALLAVNQPYNRPPGR
jgi:hypothetical protein